MPHFDPTITLGNIITMLGIVLGIWISALKLFYAFDKRLGESELVVIEHTKQLRIHAERLEKQDNLLIVLVGDIQRLVGHLEGLRSRKVG
jgi:hypothetical protein